MLKHIKMVKFLKMVLRIFEVKWKYKLKQVDISNTDKVKVK